MPRKNDEHFVTNERETNKILNEKERDRYNCLTVFEPGSLTAYQPYLETLHHYFEESYETTNAAMFSFRMIVLLITHLITFSTHLIGWFGLYKNV